VLDKAGGILGMPGVTACPPLSHSRMPRAFRITAWILAAGLAAVAARLIIFKLKTQPLFVDFLAMWTGGRIANQDPARLYDFAAVDRAQAWLLGAAAHDRPFPYPPSALLVFGPLGHLPFWIAAAFWMAGIVTAYGLVAVRLVPRERGLGLALIGLAPGVVWAGLSGQCAFLIGALAITSLGLLDRRPLLAGVLLGMAAAFKPTVLLMAPVALLAGGRWRALAGASLAGLGVIALSAAVYGLAPWRDWLMAAPAYLAHITHDPRFQSSIVTPVGLALQLGVSGWALTLWRLVFAALGVALAGMTFRRTAPLARRLTVLFGASLLVSPYAMNYETTLLAPGAVLALLTARDGRGRILALAAYVALAVAGFPGVAAGALLVFLILALAPALIRTEPLSATGRPG
jgi:hypothetical protein